MDSKTADIAGMGTDAIRWIPADDEMRVNLTALKEQILKDSEAGDRPALVVGNAGSVSTGLLTRCRRWPRCVASSGSGSMWMGHTAAWQRCYRMPQMHSPDCARRTSGRGPAEVALCAA
jgi:hypothetical protein